MFLHSVTSKRGLSLAAGRQAEGKGARKKGCAKADVELTSPSYGVLCIMLLLYPLLWGLEEGAEGAVYRGRNAEGLVGYCRPAWSSGRLPLLLRTVHGA